MLKEHTISTQFVEKYIEEIQILVQEGYKYVPNSARVSSLIKIASFVKVDENFTYEYDTKDLKDDEVAESAGKEATAHLPDWELVKSFKSKDELANYAATEFGIKLPKNKTVANMINQFIEEFKG